MRTFLKSFDTSCRLRIERPPFGRSAQGVIQEFPDFRTNIWDTQESWQQNENDQSHYRETRSDKLWLRCEATSIRFGTHCMRGLSWRIMRCCSLKERKISTS